MADAETGCPYQGAKEAYILDFTDTRKVLEVIETLWDKLPYPKSKTEKSHGNTTGTTLAKLQSE